MLQIPRLSGPWPEIGPIAHGMMGLTRDDPTVNTTKELSLTTVRAVAEAGATLWDARTLYGTPEYNSKHLLAVYFSRYPAGPAVEVELSLATTDVLYNCIGTKCVELNIPLVTWGAMGAGMFKGKHVRCNADIPEADHHKHKSRFQDGVFQQNNRLIEEVAKLAKRKQCTLPQVALAWVAALSQNTTPDGTKLPLIIPLAARRRRRDSKRT